MKLCKIAMKVVEYKDRIKLRLPHSGPFKKLLQHVTEVFYQNKKAIIDGKVPNSNALEAYNQLPEETQQAINQSIELKAGQLQPNGKFFELISNGA